MEKKRLHIVTIICFAAFIGVLSIWNVAAPKRTVSWNENRTLAAAPDLSASHIFGGRFDDDFENWFSDHFVERDFWIELKSMVRKASLAIENNDIYYAKGDRLVSRFDRVSEDVLTSNIQLIDEFTSAANTTANILLIPSAAWGAKKSLPFGAWDIDQDELLKQLEPSFASQNLIHFTEEAVPSSNLYFRTDHHWNEQGAYLGYAAICHQVLGKEPNRFTYELASPDFIGTMYSRSGAFWTKPDPIYTILPEQPLSTTVTFDDGTVLDSIYSAKRLAEKDKYTYYADGNHGRGDIHTENGTGKRAVIIKDSYSHILLPYLITEYEDIILIDLRYYHDPVSQLLEPDDDLYFIYSLDNFATDPNLAFLR
ncbi:MAG: hypothetical protein IKF60_06320 [Solobacterium sp.]|nr:hypothetical protein [Solobacterium sp.]